MPKSYDTFRQLCAKHNVTSYKVSKETGIPQTTLSMWKKRNGTPELGTLVKISDYFKVPITIFTEKGK